MAGPWEKYQAQEGPWKKYQSSDYQPSALEKAAEIATNVQETILPPVAKATDAVARGASRLMFGSEKPAELAQQGVRAVTGAIEGVGEYVAEKGAEIGLPVPVAATAGFIAANAPYMIPFGKGAQISTKLEPFSGKPGIAARMKQMRTGVEASEFERLRRDPSSFFETTSRKDAGKAIGEAKQAAGISTGVTQDISTLTPENLARARSIQSVGNKAQDEILAKIENVAKAESSLPVVQPTGKVGEPFFTFEGNYDFGPGKQLSTFKLHGDHPRSGGNFDINQVKEFGFPVKGRAPTKAAAESEPIGLPSQSLSNQDIISRAGIQPNEVSQALDAVNKRLARLERSEGAGSPAFQQWSAIKNHFQAMLEEVAPDVRQANRDFSRVALRDKFMEPLPVNQAGTMSKIGTFGFTPLAATGGAVAGGPLGAVLAGAAAQAVRSPFIAGLGTASRGLLDKVLDPVFSRLGKEASRRAIYGAYIDRVTTKNKENQ